MKLKKQIKIIFILLIIVGVSAFFYGFNTWFFKRYKDIGRNEEVKTNLEKNREEPETTKQDEKKEEKEESTEEKKTEIKKEQKKIAPLEEYFCSENSKLEGKECVIKLIQEAIVEKEENVVVVRYPFDSRNDLKLQKEECISINGTVKTEESGVVFCEVEESEIEEGSPTCLDESYTLEENKCVKEDRLPAKVRYVCPEEYYYDGESCILK